MRDRSRRLALTAAAVLAVGVPVGAAAAGDGQPGTGDTPPAGTCVERSADWQRSCDHDGQHAGEHMHRDDDAGQAARGAEAMPTAPHRDRVHHPDAGEHRDDAGHHAGPGHGRGHR